MNGPVTVAPTQSPQDDDDDDGDTSDMDTLYSVIGAIAGALLVTILVILVFVWCRRSKYDRVGAIRNLLIRAIVMFGVNLTIFVTRMKNSTLNDENFLGITIRKIDPCNWYYF